MDDDDDDVARPTSRGVVATFVVSSALWVLLFSLFLYVRKRQLLSRRAWREELRRAHVGAGAFSSSSSSTTARDREQRRRAPDALSYDYMLRWWWDVVRLPLSDIEALCGSDAYAYLRLQQLWLWCLGVATLGGVLVLLPLNLMGGMSEVLQLAFEKTTIAHLPVASSALWIPAFALLLLCLASLAIVKRWQDSFHKRIGVIEGDTVYNDNNTMHTDNNRHNDSDSDHDEEKATITASRRQLQRVQDCTVLATEVPTQCYQETRAIHEYLNERYPGELVHVSAVYDVSELQRLHDAYSAAVADLEYYEWEWQRSGQRPTIAGQQCGQHVCYSQYACCCCCCCKGPPPVDAVEHFKQQLADIRQQLLSSELSGLQPLPSGVLLITFDSPAAASEFLFDHTAARLQPCCCHVAGADRLLGEHARPPFALSEWTVRRAPAADDIIWTSLGVPRWQVLCRRTVLDSLLLLLFVFWSSPSAVLASIVSIVDMLPPSDQSSWLRFLGHYVPPLLLLVLQLVIPVLLRLAANLKGYRTHSARHTSGMRSVYFFLVLSTLLLPSLLSSSTLALLLRLFASAGHFVSVAAAIAHLSGVLGSLFPAASMFVNLLLQSALLATPIQLFRLDKWLLYRLYARNVRSVRHLNEIKHKHLRERPLLGYMYATFLAPLGIVLFYAATVPLILPAGFLWLLLRHYADKHDVLYYHRRGIATRSARIMRTVVSFQLVNAVLAVLVLFVYLIVVKRAPQPATLCLLLLLLLCCAWCWLAFYEWPRLKKSHDDRLFSDEHLHWQNVSPVDYYSPACLRRHRALLFAMPTAQRSASPPPSPAITDPPASPQHIQSPSTLVFSN